MTDGEKANHKEKVKKVMLDHLTDLGYPNMTNDEIMHELKDMWIKIEEAGLVVEDMNFQAFAAIANHEYLVAEMKDLLGI